MFHPQAEALKGLGQAITGEVGVFCNFMTTLLVGEETVSGLPVTFSTEGGGLDVFGNQARSTATRLRSGWTVENTDTDCN